MKNEWEDKTSYSRGERGTIEPRVWQLSLAGLRISVHRYRGCEGWFGSCYTTGIECHQLAAADLKAARVEFLEYLSARFENWNNKTKAALVREMTP